MMKHKPFYQRKMLLHLFVSLLYLLPMVSFAQNDKAVDRLLHEISICSDDTKKIDLILSLSHKLLLSNQDAAAVNIERAITLSKEHNYIKGIAVALTWKAMLFKYQSNLEQSFKYFEDAKLYAILLSGIEKDTVEANIYMGLGSLFGEYDMLPQSLDNYSKVERIALRINNNELLTAAKMGLANIYNKTGDYTRAIDSCRAIIDIDKSNSLKHFLLFNIGSYYLDAGFQDSAIVYFNRSLINTPVSTRSDFVFMSLLNTGKAFIVNENYEKAFTYLNKALATGTSNILYLSHTYNYLGICYFNKNNLKKALSFFEKAEQLAIEIKNYSILYEIYNQQALLYTKTNKWKEAYDAGYMMSIAKDSLTAIMGLNKIIQTKLKLEYELKLSQDKIRESQLRLREKNKQQQLINLLFLFTIVSLSVFIFFLFKTKKNRLLLKQKEIVETRLKDNLESSNKNLISKTMLSIQQKEIIVQVIESLNELKIGLNQKKQAEIFHLIKKLKSYSDDKVWKEFDYYFNKVKIRFYENLSLEFPELTSNDKRLCALLSLNLNTKEIAFITNLSPDSIRVFRTRIRKKLHINDVDIKLDDFLSKY